MDYEELARQFFYKSYELKKANHQQVLDESLQGEIFALFFIKNKGNFVMPSEISSEMNVSSARVASILNNLENKGLVNRQIDTADRRRILVSLTNKGKETADTHQNKVIGQIAKMLELLGEHDALEFVRITARLIDLAPLIAEFCKL